MSSGKRLHYIYTRVLAQDPQKHRTMVDVWAAVFGVNKSSPHHEDEIAGLVMALRSEIKLTRKQLDSNGAPASLTSPGFERLVEIASPGQLNTGWAQHRASIQTPDCRKIFEWVEWVLRSEEDGQIAGQQLQELRVELDSLEQALEKANIAPYLRDFIRRQLRTIRTALRMHVVQGIKPLEEALESVAGAFQMQDAPLKAAFASAEPEAKNLMTRASEVVKRVAQVSDDIVKIKKAGAEAVALGSSVAALMLPYLP